MRFRRFTKAAAGLLMAMSLACTPVFGGALNVYAAETEAETEPGRETVYLGRVPELNGSIEDIPAFSELEKTAAGKVVSGTIHLSLGEDAVSYLASRFSLPIGGISGELSLAGKIAVAENLDLTMAGTLSLGNIELYDGILSYERENGCVYLYCPQFRAEAMKVTGSIPGISGEDTKESDLLGGLLLDLLSTVSAEELHTFLNAYLKLLESGVTTFFKERAEISIAGEPEEESLVIYKIPQARMSGMVQNFLKNLRDDPLIEMALESDFAYGCAAKLSLDGKAPERGSLPILFRSLCEKLLASDDFARSVPGGYLILGSTQDQKLSEVTFGLLNGELERGIFSWKRIKGEEEELTELSTGSMLNRLLGVPEEEITGIRLKKNGQEERIDLIISGKETGSLLLESGESDKIKLLTANGSVLLGITVEGGAYEKEILMEREEAVPVTSLKEAQAYLKGGDIKGMYTILGKAAARSTVGDAKDKVSGALDDMGILGDAAREAGSGFLSRIGR